MLDWRRRSIQPMAERLPDGNEQNLQAEWPERAEAPTDYWLSSRPAATALAELVRLAKIRWRIERDYRELKHGFGLDHFEGRSKSTGLYPYVRVQGDAVGAVTQAGRVLLVETVRKAGLDHAIMIRSRMYVLLGEVL